VAWHFDEMNSGLLDTILLSLAEAILAQKVLQLKRKDDLYDLISSRLSEDERCFDGLDQVHFEYWGPLALSRFLSVGSWDPICNHLIDAGHRLALNDRDLDGDRDSSSFPLNWNEHFYRNMARLTARCGGNVHEKAIAEASPRSIGLGSLSTGGVISGEQSHRFTVSRSGRLSSAISADDSRWTKVKRCVGSDSSRMKYRLCVSAFSPGVQERRLR
jgi:hypothetical protein